MEAFFPSEAAAAMLRPHFFGRSYEVPGHAKGGKGLAA